MSFFFRHAARRFSTLEAPAGKRFEMPQIEAYTQGVQALHWASGGAMLASVGLVMVAQELPPWSKCTPEESASKGNLMFYHKSFGTLSLCLLFPRIAVRLASKVPAPPAGNWYMQCLGGISHIAMYGFAVGLPVTGFAMGYVGGKGVPFFYKTITPMSGEFGKAKNGKLAGNMYKIHTQMGYMFKFFVPVHVGAVGLHALKGQNLLARITPFFK